MDMQSYLETTRHASSTLIEAYTKELREMKQVAEDYNSHIDRVKEVQGELRQRMHAGDTFQDWQALAEVWQGIPAKYAALRQLDEKRFALKDSTGALCGALLQIAKQGLSAVHGSPRKWPVGRLIGGQPLSQIVLNARNQAMHFEEGNFSRDVQILFASLANSIGSHFDLQKHPGENLSRHIVDLLEWHNPTAYERDMGSMA